MRTDTTLLRSIPFTFQVRIPPAVQVDSSAQHVVEGASYSPMFHTWMFRKPPVEGDTDVHWQRIVINAVQGLKISDSIWNTLAATAIKSMLDQTPHGAEIVESDVRWRADVAEYRVGIHDAVRGEFINQRCLGSQVGRPRTVVVCVYTAAPTAEALKPVRESLALISQRSATPGR